mmetsp:Transcript_9374/g.16596  ORF Transcript_9374/g.16596 Transcript_9374/m.16596 type:complete len:81 (+) Transcript_9374:1215-1457(+)
MLKAAISEVTFTTSAFSTPTCSRIIISSAIQHLVYCKGGVGRHPTEATMRKPGFAESDESVSCRSGSERPMHHLTAGQTC